VRELAYVNGEISDVSQGKVHIEDRGYQFGEGVYEVIKAYNGKPFLLQPHFLRLRRSAEGLGIMYEWTNEFLEHVVEQLLRESEQKFANIYLQITAGSAPRSHLLSQEPTPNLIATIREAPEVDTTRGVKIVSVEDLRWKRCWIKSTNLVANVMAKKQGREQGAIEVVMFEQDGRITEGGSSNVFAVLDGVLVTPDLNHNILPGITREVVLKMAGEINIPCQEGELFLADLNRAEEIMITSTTFEITPVIQFNNKKVGDGVPGPVAGRLAEQYRQKIKKQCY